MNISQYNIELIKKLKKWPAMSVARVKSSRVNIETTVSLLNLHFCGTISPNFMFSTHLTSLKLQGVPEKTLFQNFSAELPRMPRIAQNAQICPKFPGRPKMPRINKKLSGIAQNAQISVLICPAEKF